MSYITVADAQAYAERSKLDLGSALDGDLEVQIAAQVLAQVAQRYTTTTWLDESTTPLVVRSIIAMLYTAQVYMREYSEDEGVPPYARFLVAQADKLLDSITQGTTVLVEVPTDTEDTSLPLFYPTDESTATAPTWNDLSLGPEKFTMGNVF